MKAMRIGKKKIGPSQPVFIIAEAGVNHNGRLDLALKLIDAAADSGADAVKFQTFHADDVVTESVKLAEYQKKNAGIQGSQIAMLKRLELKEEHYPILMARAKRRGILFLSTPHGGFGSVDFLTTLKMPAFKIGSGDLTNLPLLAYVAKKKKPIFLSTGMAFLKEIRSAVKAIHDAGNKKVVLLHCTSNYPCSPEDTNLRVMSRLSSLAALIGFSDHTSDSQAAIMAVSFGACVIEKHLTLSRKLSGPDHQASEEPGDFRNMVEQVRRASLIMGSGAKRPTRAEMKLRKVVRKSIITSKDIREGDVLTIKNVCIKRPGTGLAPHYFPRVIGRTAKKDMVKNYRIRLSDIS